MKSINMIATSTSTVFDGKQTLSEGIQLLDEADINNFERTKRLSEDAAARLNPSELTPETVLSEIDLDPFVRFQEFTDADRGAVIKEFVRACEEIGFLVIKNHGVPQKLIEEMLELAYKFYRETPREEKLKLKYPVPDVRLGYYDMGNGANFYMGPFEENAKHPNVLPNTPKFAETAKRYYEEMVRVESILYDLLAQGLEIDRSIIQRNLGNHKGLLLLNYFAKLSDDHAPTWAGAHTDWGPLTILLQGKPRLNVIKGKDWYRVNTNTDKFVVNLGDAMQRWTNGRFQSTIHSVNRWKDEDRVSIPYFSAQAIDMSDDTKITPLVSKPGPAEESQMALREFIFRKQKAFYDFRAGK